MDRAGFAGRRVDVVIEHHDFLPDFAGQSIGELFDVVDRLQYDGVGSALCVEGGQFANQRQQLTAIVEVASQLEWGE